MIAYPANLKPAAIEWGITSPGEIFTSDLTGANQTAMLPGSRWSGSVTYPPMTGRTAREYTAFAVSLRGMGKLTRIVPHGQGSRGIASDNGQVDGEGAAGITLNVKGLPPSVTGYLLAGDYFTVGEELKILTADASTDADGKTTFHFVPPIRGPLKDNELVNITAPTLLARLLDPDGGRWLIDPGNIYTATLQFIEHIAGRGDELTTLGETITFGGEAIEW